MNVVVVNLRTAEVGIGYGLGWLASDALRKPQMKTD